MILKEAAPISFNPSRFEVRNNTSGHLTYCKFESRTYLLLPHEKGSSSECL